MGHSIDSDNLIANTFYIPPRREEPQEERYIAVPFFFLDDSDSETD